MSSDSESAIRMLQEQSETLLQLKQVGSAVLLIESSVLSWARTETRRTDQRTKTLLASGSRARFEHLSAEDKNPGRPAAVNPLLPLRSESVYGIQAIESRLYSCMPRDVRLGLQWIKEICAQKNISGVFGMLCELFTTEPTFYQAVQTTAGTARRRQCRLARSLLMHFS